MSINFDPKTKSYFDLVFGSAGSSEKLKEEAPGPQLKIPNIGSDIPDVLKKSPESLGGIMQRYQRLRDNFLERHENYEKVLKGYLKPAEAIDIFDRLEDIDRELLEVEQNLQQAMKMADRVKNERVANKAEESQHGELIPPNLTPAQAQKMAELLENFDDHTPQDIVDDRVEVARRQAMDLIHVDLETEE